MNLIEGEATPHWIDGQNIQALRSMHPDDMTADNIRVVAHYFRAAFEYILEWCDDRITVRRDFPDGLAWHKKIDQINQVYSRLIKLAENV